MNKSKLDELPGKGNIVILSYNRANGDNCTLGNHILISTDYDKDKIDYSNNFALGHEILMNLSEWKFKTFAIIKQLFPYVEQVFMSTLRLFDESIEYNKKETETEGYQMFYCSDEDYGEYIREDDFQFAFRVENTNEELLSIIGRRVMDYTVFVNNETTLTDEPVKYYSQLSKDEAKDRKKEFKEFHLSKKECRVFDQNYIHATQCKWFVGYCEDNDYVWAEPENEFQNFTDSEFDVKYGDTFYLFKLEKGWLSTGEGSLYFHKICKTKEEVISLYNRPLEYFREWLECDIDAEPYTDFALGINNTNTPKWYCVYSWKEYSIGDGQLSVELFEGGPEERKKVKIQ